MVQLHRQWHLGTRLEAMSNYPLLIYVGHNIGVQQLNS
jgi:hypothetical protein